MKFDTSYLELLLQKAKYEQGLGVELLRISETTIGNEKIVLLEVKVKKGTDIKPHVHKHGGEICIPLTKGSVRFGRPRKDKKGHYELAGSEVETDWDVMDQDLEPGRTIEVPQDVAHHFMAFDDTPLIMLFILPEAHAAASDRFYCTYPA